MGLAGWNRESASVAIDVVRMMFRAVFRAWGFRRGLRGDEQGSRAQGLGFYTCHETLRVQGLRGTLSSSNVSLPEPASV